MRWLLPLALLVGPLLAAGPAPATGEIRGRVKLVPLAVGSQAEGPQEGLVYLEDGPPGGEMPKPPFTLVQKGKDFSPHLLVVPLGASVDFPNDDPFYHDVFSPGVEDGFQLGLYKGGVSKQHLFAKAGVFPIFCNIHPKMHAWVAVVQNRFFVQPAKDGTFALPPLPPGRYHLVAWFPWGDRELREVAVEDGKPVKVEVILQEKQGAGSHDNKEGKPYGAY